jgi:uncharacterized protein
LYCNAPLRAVERSAVESKLPPSVRERYERFSTCDVCERVFWEGSHWQRMRAMVDGLIAAP